MNDHSQIVLRRIRQRVGFVYSELGYLVKDSVQLTDSDKERICSELSTLSEQFAAVALSGHAEA